MISNVKKLQKRYFVKYILPFLNVLYHNHRRIVSLFVCIINAHNAITNANILLESATKKYGSIPTYLHTTILIHDNTIVTIVKIPHTLVF